MERKVAEMCKDYLLLSPAEKINEDFKEDGDTDKEEFNRVKAIIHEMLLEAIPHDLVKETVQKRRTDPIQVMMLIMIKYQPGSKKEKKALLQQITNPEVCWKEEQALKTLKMWKRRIQKLGS